MFGVVFRNNLMISNEIGRYIPHFLHPKKTTLESKYTIRNDDLAKNLLMMASTMIWMGLASVSRWMISMACLTIRTAISFLPLLRPCIISEFVRRSMIGHCAFLNLFTEYRPAVCGRYVACFVGCTPM